jgi:hypothetical protein
LEFENILDLNEFNIIKGDNESFYDNNYWNKINLHEKNYDKILDDMLLN